MNCGPILSCNGISLIGETKLTLTNKVLTLESSDGLYLEYESVSSVSWEQMISAKGDQEFLLLTAHLLDSQKRCWFLDYDGYLNQNSLREISPCIETLAQALVWLLPPNYFQRQGDIGIYIIDRLPKSA